MSKSLIYQIKATKPLDGYYNLTDDYYDRLKEVRDVTRHILFRLKTEIEPKLSGILFPCETEINPLLRSIYRTMGHTTYLTNYDRLSF